MRRDAKQNSSREIVPTDLWKLPSSCRGKLYFYSNTLIAEQKGRHFVDIVNWIHLVENICIPFKFL